MGYSPALETDKTRKNPFQFIRCDACGCAFTPKLLTQQDGEIEYTFFRCYYCGKAYMISLTDEKLRQDIAKYVAIIGKGNLNDEERQEAIELLRANKERAQLLKYQHFKENGE